ncbi:MAG: hypothetical protein MUC56_15555 [Thermoanaerobaculales bacterium]|jgi:hypothetical protein|nr:hypothetical protein [Thermoanaerobaculales bacterium]
MSGSPPTDGEAHPGRDEALVRVFVSFDDENEAEHRQLASMSPQERMLEFAVLQARRWGQAWGRSPIVKRATWETVSW